MVLGRRPYGCEEKSWDAAFRTRIAPSTDRLVLNLQCINSLWGTGKCWAQAVSNWCGFPALVFVGVLP